MQMGVMCVFGFSIRFSLKSSFVIDSVKYRRKCVHQIGKHFHLHFQKLVRRCKKTVHWENQDALFSRFYQIVSSLLVLCI